MYYSCISHLGIEGEVSSRLTKKPHWYANLHIIEQSNRLLSKTTNENGRIVGVIGYISQNIAVIF